MPNPPMPPSPLKQALGLLGWLALTFAASALGAIASIDAGSFYQQLERPGWAPPAGVFGPVWSALYLLMAVAAWLVWRERSAPGRAAALAWYLVQLAVNVLWSWLFFGWRLGALAFIDVVLLLALIVATLVAFWRIRPLAGALLVPYLAWVGFATALTWSVWRSNIGVL
jgi:tryptophan-rich sensory protein